MSHITEATAEVTDLECLKEAAQDLGGKLHENQKTHKWWGRWVGDAPLPAGVKEEDLGKCDHAISFPGCEYEVGVVKQANDKYALRYDYYATGGLERKLGGKNAELLMQNYGVRKAVKQAHRQRLRTRQVVQSDGSIKVIVEGM